VRHTPDKFEWRLLNPNRDGARDFTNVWHESSRGRLTPDQPNCLAPPAADPERLMIRYQQGDALAARELVDLMSARLYGFFSSQLGNRPQADDMLQEVWLRIHRARHSYRPGEPLLPWIYAIARRVRVDNYRRRRRSGLREVGLGVLENVHNHPTADSAFAELPSFSELIAPLPDSQREVLTMLKVNGLSIEEVARATSSTVGAVKQKVHRAYHRLRSVLPKTILQDSGKGADQ
jgi:RNA polymerase sigma-70 factor, ECF subfamily